MDCRRFSEKLAEAALEPGDVRDAGLAAHLTTCAVCRLDLEAQRRLAQAMDIGLTASVSVSPSPAFAAGVRARLAEEPAPRASWFSGWVPVTAGALAVVVLMAAWFARREAPGRTPRSDQATINSTVQRPVGGSGESQVASTAPIKPGRALQTGPRPSTSVRHQRRRDPEVIVAAGQREAVLRFYAAVLSGRTDATWALEEMKPLEVAELKIPLLEPATSETRSPESENSNGLLF